MSKQKKIIVCGFPGIGKSHLQRTLEKDNIKVEDSDSSDFPKDNFPNNYLDHIQEDLDKNGVKLVSTHKEVLDGLEKRGIEYILVYPDREEKETYIKRYEERGSPKAFIDVLSSKWNSFMDDIESAHPTKRIKLKKGQHLCDVLKVKSVKKERRY